MARERKSPPVRESEARFEQLNEGFVVGGPGGGRYADAAGYGPPEPASAALLSTVTLLAGVWLVISPSALGYGDEAVPFGGVWNETVVGIAIAVVALVRILSPAATAPLSAVNLALGAWLLIAPFALDYDGTGRTDAVWNDVVVGVVVIVFAGASWAVGSLGTRGDRYRRDGGA